MKIIFFSEIRWDYLITRKQQIISRFPKDWEVLFLEPHKAGKKMNIAPVWRDNICVTTMPLFFKNFKSKPIKWLLSFKLVRGFVLLFGWLWIDKIIRKTEFYAPDLIMASNIYAAPFVKRLCKGLPVIYDMNDNHLAFPNMPKWAEGYYRSLCVSANKIVLASEKMKELLPENGKFGNHVITNGVENRLFRDYDTILYVGAVAEFVDVPLLAKIAESFPSHILRLIGPVSINVIELERFSNVEFVSELPLSIVADQIKLASVCLIPFLSGTRTAMATHPGKALLYLASGKPVVSIGRPKTDEENRNPYLIYSAESHKEFLFYMKAVIDKGRDKHAKARQDFAETNDWNGKAKEMIKIIQRLIVS